jgi:hypothetical protein
MCFALQIWKGIMSQKPLTMEQLKQVLELRKDRVAIREIVRRTGIICNAIKSYLGLLEQSGDISYKYITTVGKQRKTKGTVYRTAIIVQQRSVILILFLLPVALLTYCF